MSMSAVWQGCSIFYAYVYVALDELPIVGFGDDFAVEFGGGVRHVEVTMI